MNFKGLLLFLLMILYGSKGQQTNKNDGNEIVKFENVPNSGDGTYYFSYETSDGTYRTEKGELKTDKDNNVIIVVSGSYGYMDPDGKLHSVQYTADENGYHEAKKKLDTAVYRISPGALGSLVGGGLG